MTDTAGDTMASCSRPVVVSTSPVMRDRMPPVFMSHSRGSGKRDRPESENNFLGGIRGKPTRRTGAASPVTSSTLSTMYRMNNGSAICIPAPASASAKSAATLHACGLSHRRYSRRYCRRLPGAASFPGSFPSPRAALSSRRCARSSSRNWRNRARDDRGRSMRGWESVRGDWWGCLPTERLPL